jgi:hypothetical protein
VARRHRALWWDRLRRRSLGRHSDRIGDLVRPWSRPSGQLALASGLLAIVTRPDAYQLSYIRCSAAVGSGLDHDQNRALQADGQQDLPLTAPRIGGLRSLVFSGGDLSDPAEDHSRKHAADHADDHAHRLVKQLDHGCLIRAASRPIGLKSALAPGIAIPNGAKHHPVSK